MTSSFVITSFLLFYYDDVIIRHLSFSSPLADVIPSFFLVTPVRRASMCAGSATPTESSQVRNSKLSKKKCQSVLNAFLQLVRQRVPNAKWPFGIRGKWAQVKKNNEQTVFPNLGAFQYQIRILYVFVGKIISSKKERNAFSRFLLRFLF